MISRKKQLLFFLKKTFIFTKVDEAGGKGLALMVDIRDEEAVAKSIEETVRHFGGIDILVNNASAIALTGTEVCLWTFYIL